LDIPEKSCSNFVSFN